jgi:hypothetical protein
VLCQTCIYKGEVRSRTGHEGSEGEQRCSCTLSLTSVLDGGGWSTPRSGRFTPGKENRYSLYRTLGGCQGRSGRVWKISLTPGFFLLLCAFYALCTFISCVLMSLIPVYTQHKHPCPRRDLNPHPLQAIGRKPSP